MYVSKRLLLPALVAALVASSLVFAISASAHHDSRPSTSEPFLDSSLAPSIPTDPTIHGVLPGGAAWALSDASVRVSLDGRVKIRVDGLILPSLGTAGPVTGIVAELFCGADSDTKPAASTAAVPLSTTGDAEISTTVTLPSTCLAPIVLINPMIGTTLHGTIYIAITGYTP